MSACLRQLPRLTAEESMLSAERVAVGSGTAPGEIQQTIRRNWELDRSGGVIERKKSKRDRPTPAQLARAGIKMEIVPKKTKT